MYKQDLDRVFKDMDQIFKEVDKVFKQADKRMEDAFETLLNDAKPEPWEKWFAWHPVTIKGKRRWMKTVYRRTKLKFGDQRLIREWEYGDMFDVLKEAGNGTSK